jgi:hypothetical protein
MAKLLSILLRGLSLFVHWVLPRLIRIAGFCFWSMLCATAAVWVGWGPAIQRISDEGMKRAAEWGLPSSLDPYLYHFFRIGAFCQILLGWLLLAMVTASAINLVLYRLTGWIIIF